MSEEAKQRRETSRAIYLRKTKIDETNRNWSTRGLSTRGRVEDPIVLLDVTMNDCNRVEQQDRFDHLRWIGDQEMKAKATCAVKVHAIYSSSAREYEWRAFSKLVTNRCKVPPDPNFITRAVAF
jgi:hypothetical protein